MKWNDALFVAEIADEYYSKHVVAPLQATHDASIAELVEALEAIMNFEDDDGIKFRDTPDERLAPVAAKAKQALANYREKMKE